MINIVAALFGTAGGKARPMPFGTASLARSLGGDLYGGDSDDSDDDGGALARPPPSTPAGASEPPATVIRHCPPRPPVSGPNMSNWMGGGRRRRSRSAKGRKYMVLDSTRAWPATEKEAHGAYKKGKDVRYYGRGDNALAFNAVRLSDMIAGGDRRGATKAHSAKGFDATEGFNAAEARRRDLYF